MISIFNPNSAASKDSGIFGLPFRISESSLVYIPVPWEVTTSYGGGTSKGPKAIFKASHQVDLFDWDVLRPYECGLYLKKESPEVLRWNQLGKEKAHLIIEKGGDISDEPGLQAHLQEVNALGALLNDWVRKETLALLKNNQIPAILGGDHSVPFGALQAVAEFHPQFGILHFDAHSDTRKAYEGFTWSHASIMHNVLEGIPQVSKLVQVGIRDFCEEELNYCQSKGNRVKTFFDSQIQSQKAEGQHWKTICDEIVRELPQKVWISFDIDGLDPKLCPHTGTPVPSGLEFSEATYLLKALALSKRQIIGFDLNEVAPDPQEQSEWDANVAARLLYKLTAWTLYSQGKARLR
ncbi:MAG: arginase [Proteobacteria bacterium]|nr:arginase [Pseudomonadota bacterium]NDC22994.1 arginase [Pseudomonadota bacterium]NDD03346.1 arginase [Pseudomonadota bacterium]NDG25567.1 arginase [Pseudomonadota bacterium]